MSVDIPRTHDDISGRPVRSAGAAGTDLCEDRERLPVRWTLSGRPHENAPVQQIAISRQPFTIGRRLENDLCLANPSVSGRHAELVLVGNEIHVRDLGSTNGTLLNGRPLREPTALGDGDILHFGSAMFTLQRAGRDPAGETIATFAAEEAMAHVQFETLLRKPAVYPYFQPIVRLADAGRVAYEVLCRSPLIGLETPPKMFRVAALHSAENELSRVCRWEGLRGAQSLGTHLQYYLNTHPGEIGTGELLDSLTALRAAFPEAACVLEVHESAVASSGHLRELRSVLDDLDMQLAYDDFGAGQARIAELTEVPPDILKFDLKLVRQLGAASRQRRATVESLVRMVRDLGIVPLAEGVESRADAEACREIGFELAQGYLFGKPGPASDWIDADPANASKHGFPPTDRKAT